jgi:peptidoglycan/LPS O-acetylase OafA/YrhL
MKHEIKSLTGLRGIAALYVVIYHWYMVIAVEKTTTKDISLFDSFIENFLSHGYLSVDLFFILSGFVLSLSVYKKFGNGISTRDWMAFMRKRFLRIFPLYISMTLLYFLLFDRTHVSSLLVNLTLLQGIIPFFNNSIIPPGWSLTNEWLMYLIFPSFFYLMLKLKGKNWALFSLAVVILLFISSTRALIFNWGNYKKMSSIEGFYPIIDFTRGPSSFLRTLAAYLLGVYAFNMHIRGKDFPFIKYLALPIVMLLFISRSDIIIILLLPFFLLYILKENLTSKLFSSKPMHFLGLISYSIYVNHYLFLNSYNKVSQILGMESNAISFTYTIVGTLVLSCITYYGIEKPGVRLFRRKALQPATVRV